METKFVDANCILNKFLRDWLYSRKGHRKARWLKKWNRMVMRSRKYNEK